MSCRVTSRPFFRSRLEKLLFRRSFPQLLLSACEVTRIIIDTLVLFLLTYDVRGAKLNLITYTIAAQAQQPCRLLVHVHG